jgi:phosphoglycolate phosphatase-like HAD superfamily hydrolase
VSGLKFPSVIIFDVDGVLVDVRGSFQKTTLETVEFFTGTTSLEKSVRLQRRLEIIDSLGALARGARGIWGSETKVRRTVLGPERRW